ncbi:acyl-CoA dehydrogenase family protein [Pseudomonas sp. HK3]
MHMSFEDQLALPCYSDFDEFSRVVLSYDKTKSLEAVLMLGLRCSNLSQAFALAYRCALQSLLPQLNQSQWAAMCVTESQGNHPRNIQAHINQDGSVTGEKSFVTMAGLAEQLLVIAKAQGEQKDDSRPVLKAVLVDYQQAGVSVAQMPAMKMLSDIPHGILTLNNAACDILTGDGYSDYSKLFRVLEDAHILMAASSFILNQAYRAGQVDVVAKALAMVGLLNGIPLVSNPWVHLQLAQGFDQFLQLCEMFEQELPKYNGAVSDAWFVDKKLFSIASGARKTRTEKALHWVAAKSRGEV